MVICYPKIGIAKRYTPLFLQLLNCLSQNKAQSMLSRQSKLYLISLRNGYTLNKILSWYKDILSSLHQIPMVSGFKMRVRDGTTTVREKPKTKNIESLDLHICMLLAVLWAIIIIPRSLSRSLPLFIKSMRAP